MHYLSRSDEPVLLLDTGTVGLGRVSFCDLRICRTDECFPVGMGRHLRDESRGWQAGSGGVMQHQSSWDGCSATGLLSLQSIAEWHGYVGEGRQLNDYSSHQQAAGILSLPPFKR